MPQIHFAIRAVQCPVWSFIWGRAVILMHPGLAHECLCQIVNTGTCLSLIKLVNAQQFLLSDQLLVFLLGARSWLRELMCVLSILSTQRAETASCSVLRRMRRKNWRPRSRAPGLSLNARYENLEIDGFYFFMNKCAQ